MSNDEEAEPRRRLRETSPRMDTYAVGQLRKYQLLAACGADGGRVFWHAVD